LDQKYVSLINNLIGDIVRADVWLLSDGLCGKLGITLSQDVYFAVASRWASWIREIQIQYGPDVERS
jgi:hypothetical protein